MFHLLIGSLCVLNGVVCYLLVKVNANQDRLLLQLEKRLTRLENRRSRDDHTEGISRATTKDE